ncbi:PilZ domain-containing protein [Actinoplanes sp. NPDC049118]|uniref:PilZ domain-containing protein n=1 Tax=Actinoplanes sp. NPDC049118 TaxID=3155769 RepID=UPI0033FCB504
MAWDWLKRMGVVVADVEPAEPEDDSLDTALCPRGSEATLIVTMADEPEPVVMHTRVAIVDGERIVLANTRGAAKPDDEAVVTMQWAVDSGVRRVPVRVESASENTWTVLALGDVIHQQRRRWIRVRTTLRVATRLPEKDDWVDGLTANLSAGGMAANLGSRPEGLVAGIKLEINLDLPDEPLTLAAVVTDVVDDEDGEGCTVRMDFSDVEEAHRERIAAHVSRLQREELARRRKQGTD